MLSVSYLASSGDLLVFARGIRRGCGGASGPSDGRLTAVDASCWRLALGCGI